MVVNRQKWPAPKTFQKVTYTTKMYSYCRISNSQNSHSNSKWKHCSSVADPDPERIRFCWAADSGSGSVFGIHIRIQVFNFA